MLRYRFTQYYTYWYSSHQSRFQHTGITFTAFLYFGGLKIKETRSASHQNAKTKSELGSVENYNDMTMQHISITEHLLKSQK